MPLDLIQEWIAHYGYPAIFFLLAVGIVGLPVPDETLLTLTGFLIFKGTLHPVPAYLSALAGTLAGISISYSIGSMGGKRFLRRFGKRIHVSAERVGKVETWFQRRGRWSLVVGYFIPGVRHVIAIVAATSGLPFGEFARYAYGGAVVWSACFVGGGFLLGEEWNRFHETARPVALGIMVFVILGVGTYFLYRRLRDRRRSRRAARAGSHRGNEAG
jgi:membrane protein DedA with SNARE-associated domain